MAVALRRLPGRWGSRLRLAGRVVLAREGPGPARRLAEVLGEGDIPARIVADLDEAADLGASDGSGDGVVRILPASAYQSFLIPSQNLLLLASRRSRGELVLLRAPLRRCRRGARSVALTPYHYIRVIWWCTHTMGWGVLWS